MFYVDGESVEKMRAGTWDSKDSQFIADMLVPLTPEEALERANKFGVPNRTLEMYAPYAGSVWTCRHWDEETRLCTVYEERPDMCRFYPYGRPCEHGCDYTQVLSDEDFARYNPKRETANANA